jgi:hypothetical protein
MDNDNNNNSRWDKHLIVAVIAMVVGAIVAIATPELRNLLCLEKDKPAASAPAAPVPQPVEEATPPSGPLSATLHENKTQFVEAAKTGLSITFNEEYKIVTLTIAPDGKQASNRAVLNGYTEEFTSSAGVFLVHILHVDWDSRTVTVQVNRKS